MKPTDLTGVGRFSYDLIVLINSSTAALKFQRVESPLLLFQMLHVTPRCCWVRRVPWWKVTPWRWRAAVKALRRWRALPGLETERAAAFQTVSNLTSSSGVWITETTENTSVWPATPSVPTVPDPFWSTLPVRASWYTSGVLQALFG